MNLVVFAIGFVAGIAISALAFVVLAYFRSPLERVASVAQRNLSNIGPRPRGFIVNPETDAEAVRRGIVERNSREGRDTPVSELI